MSEPMAERYGVLNELVQQEAIDLADAEVALAWGRIFTVTDPVVLQASALALHAVREGSVCLDTSLLADFLDVAHLDAQLAASHVVGPADRRHARPLVLDDGLLYLNRYHHAEQLVAADLDARALARPTFPGGSDYPQPVGVALTQAQLDAVTAALERPFTIVAGGPGTGKTTVVATIVAALEQRHRQDPTASGGLRVALVAPTGKAAARLAEAVAEAAHLFPDPTAGFLSQLRASTVHRLLGGKPGGAGLRHGPENPLLHDVLIVDEASMIALTLMRDLLSALTPATRLILVGDPDQLTSVEAGAVLGDLVQRYQGGSGLVTTLEVGHRYDGAIAALAQAVKAGDDEAAAAILGSDSSVQLLPAAAVDDVVAPLARNAADRMITAGLDDDALEALKALEMHRVLCARRHGPEGVSTWAARVEQWVDLSRYFGPRVPPWYPGRPLLNQSNDRALGIFNGDTGVVVRTASGQAEAVFGSPQRHQRLALSRLADVVTTRALSVHKSQGSQFEVVTLVLPEPGSALLKREVLYTALTRARHAVQIVGELSELQAAIRQPIARASGLGRVRGS